MSADELSLSFASSMGIEDIREEYLNRSNLYTDLDQLEKSVQAEFEQYMNQVRSFPFNEDIEHPDDSECAVQTENTQESQYEELEGDSADQVLEHIDTDVSSWQEYFDNNVVERSNMEMNRNSNLSVIPQTQGNDLSEQNAHNRSMSPGEYFGARSLPLDSIDRVWKQPSIDVDQHDSVIEDQHSYSSSTNQDRKKNVIDDLIDSKFKSLPRSLRLFPKYELPEIELHHPYTQKRTHSNGSSIPSTHQECSSRNRYESSNHSTRSGRLQSFNRYTSPTSNQCIIEPSSPLRFLCELSSKTIYAKVIYLKITNSTFDSVKTFNLYSRKNMLDFEYAEGIIQAQEKIKIKIKVQSSALIPYQRQQFDEYPSLSDKILVLIDHSQVNELDVYVDFMALDDEEDAIDDEQDPSQDPPKCKFCALEKGYPLLSL